LVDEGPTSLPKLNTEFKYFQTVISFGTNYNSPYTQLTQAPQPFLGKEGSILAVPLIPGSAANV